MAKSSTLLISLFFISQIGCSYELVPKDTWDAMKNNKGASFTAPAPRDSVEHMSLVLSLKPGHITSATEILENKTGKYLVVRLLCTKNSEIKAYWMNLGPKEITRLRFSYEKEDVISFSCGYDVWYR